LRLAPLHATRFDNAKLCPPTQLNAYKNCPISGEFLRAAEGTRILDILPIHVCDPGRRARGRDRLARVRRRSRSGGRAVRRPRGRLSFRSSAADNRSAIVSPSVTGEQDQENMMKPSDMKSNDELLAEQLRTDPGFRAEWERTALGRAVAVAIVRYRADHDLSQRDLALRLGMKQPQIARLELGEVNPRMDTLMRIAAQLQVEFTIDVRPAGAPARSVTKRAQTEGLVGTFSTDEAELLVAARE